MVPGTSAAAEPGHGLYGPRRITPSAIAPAQVPSAIPQARSSTSTVWLVPSRMPAIRTALLRKRMPLPRPLLLRPRATSEASLPAHPA